MARAAGGRVLAPGIAGQGLNPFVIDRGDSEELLQRIGSLRRLIEVMVGERLSAERRSSLDHALAGYYAERRERTGFRDFYAYLEESGGGDPESSSGRAIAHLLRPFATGSLRHLLSDEGDDLLTHEALVTVFDLHLLEPELRPAAAMVCTETVWAAAAQDPRPRLLVVDEVWSIMQHPEGAAFMVSVAKRARKHRLGLQFITQDVQDLLSEDSSRAITGHSGQGAPPERRLQAAAPAGRRRHQHRGRSLRPAAGAATLAALLPARGRDCWPGATASPCASRPPPRRPRSSSGGPAPGTRPIAREKEATSMSLNVKKTPVRRRQEQARPGAAGGDAAAHRRAHAFGGGEPAPVHRRPRALLPGAGRRHGRREPAGPLPGRPGGAGPAGRPLPPGPHPAGAGGRGPHLRPRGRAGLGPDAAARRPGVRPPAHLPGRRPAGPRLRPPDRPDGRPLRAGGGGAGPVPPAAALPGSRLVPGPPGPGRTSRPSPTTGSRPTPTRPSPCNWTA